MISEVKLEIYRKHSTNRTQIKSKHFIIRRIYTHKVQIPCTTLVIHPTLYRNIKIRLIRAHTDIPKTIH